MFKLVLIFVLCRPFFWKHLMFCINTFLFDSGRVYIFAVQITSIMIL